MTIFKKNWASKGQKLQKANIVASQPEVANSNRIISVPALKARLVVAERDAVRTTTNKYVVDIWADLIGRTYVNLDLDEVAQGLGYVLHEFTTVPNFQDVTGNTMTVVDEQARLTELLIDGSKVELYKGVL